MINRAGKIQDQFQYIELLALKQAAVGNLRFMTYKTVMSVNDYIITENEKYENDYRENLILLKKYQHQYSQFSLSDEEKMLSANINENLDSVIYYAEEILMITKPKSSSRAAMLMEMMDYKFADEVFENAVLLFDYTHNQILSEKQDFIEIRKSIHTYIILIFSVALLMVALFFFLSKKNISNPILALSKAAESISKGDYSQSPLIKTNDEIELLSKVFSKMAVSIQESQQKLLESKYFNESIIETIPSGLIVVKKSTGTDLNIYDACKVVAVNRSFCEMFDIPLANAIGKPVAELLHEINLSEVCRNVVSDGKTVWNVQCECQTPSKGKMILNLSLTGLELGSENILIVIDDVTELKLAEESLRIEKEKAQKYLDVAEVMLLVLDNDGKVLLINTKGCRILGYSENEIIGKNWFDVFIPKGIKRDVNNLFTKIISGHEDIFQYHENPIITKNGDEKLMAWHNTVIHDDSGKIIATLSSGEDITERREIEISLKNSEERFRILAQTAADAIIMINDNFEIILFNKSAEKIFGYRSEEVINKPIDLLIPERYLNLYKISTRQYLETGESRLIGKTRELIGQRKNGETFPLGLSLSESTIGNEITFTGIARDITERKTIEETLKKSEKNLRELNSAKDKLFSIISHDLRSPFNSIIGFAEMLNDTYDELSDDDRKEFVKNITTSSKQTYELVENLLDWSKLERGKIEFKPKILRLENIISEIVTLVKGNIVRKKIKVSTELNTGVKVFADENMLHSIILNLVTNALKFTPKDGNINIQAEENGDYIMISVIDNGVGIPADKIEKLFNFTANISTRGTDGEKGTGLGLPLVQEYVHRNGGTIKVHSELGKGTSFSFTIPGH